MSAKPITIKLVVDNTKPATPSQRLRPLPDEWKQLCELVDEQCREIERSLERTSRMLEQKHS